MKNCQLLFFQYAATVLNSSASFQKVIVVLYILSENITKGCKLFIFVINYIL